MTTETKQPKQKFYRRMAAFKVLGITPGLTPWKELRLALSDEQNGEVNKLVKSIRGLSGPQVLEGLFGGGEAATKPSASRNGRSKPAPRKGTGAKKPDEFDLPAPGEDVNGWVVLQDNFKNALAAVKPAVATRAALPETLNVLIQTDRGRLKLTATNLELAIHTWVGAQIEAVGALTVPYKALYDAVRALPQGRVALLPDEDGAGLSLTCAGRTLHLAGGLAENYPPIPSLPDGGGVRIHGGGFVAALDRVAVAASRDDSRPILTGVKVELSGDKFALAAADGFRLAVETGGIGEAAESEVGAIVPLATALAVVKLLRNEPELAVSASENLVCFKGDNVELVTQAIRGTFPDYEKLIPYGLPSRVVTNLDALRDAVESAAVTARDGSGIIRFLVDPKAEGGGAAALTVTARAEEQGETTIVLDAILTGDPARVALNAKFIRDALASVRGDSVTLEISTPSAPMVVRAPEMPGFTCVVMPMFVQWDVRGKAA